MVKCLRLIVKAAALSLLTLFALSAQASQQKQYKTVEVIGSGVTLDKALAMALNNAVSQVNGTVVSQQIRIEETKDEIRMGLLGNTITIPSKEVNTGLTKSYSEGVIKSYKVIKTQFDSENKRHTITISAVVKYLGEYENIGIDRNKLLSVVVGLLRFEEQQFQGLNGLESGGEVSRRLTDRLIELLTQSNKFRLLDRRNLPILLTEDVITQSLGANTGQQVKFQQKLSADLFAAGSITHFNIAAKQVKSYGTIFESYDAELIVNIRVIETATGEVRFAKRFEQYLNHDQIKAEIDKYQPGLFSNKKSDKRRVQYAIETLMLADVSNQVIGAFFPDYQAQTLRTFDDSKKGEKTSISDSPGSSEKPIRW